MKKALITGISGQDGSYLAELLLDKGYEVHGLIRNASRVLDTIASRAELHPVDLTDSAGITEVIKSVHPDEVYNLAAQSQIAVSFDIPVHTTDVNATGPVRLLEAIRRYAPEARYYQAASSEIFGMAKTFPQTEKTSFRPGNPYACTKAFAYWITVTYREAYGLFACNGITYNHESPRRAETFVTRKITRSIARILAGKQEHLYLGNLDTSRDWGHAKDFVEAMWMMLQAPKPDDFVLATGETHTIREFLTEAFSLVGRRWEDHVRINEKFFRPVEPTRLVGDPTKARERLGWQPKIRFKELVRLMLEEDLKLEGLDPSRLMSGGTAQEAA